MTSSATGDRTIDGRKLNCELFNCFFNMLDRYDSLKLATFSGKGGVGKTTLSCSFARRWAKQFPQERILLLSTDPAHSLGDVLGMEVTEVATTVSDLPNLQVRALNAEQLLAEFESEYAEVLQLLVERGSFIAGEDLKPIWDLGWPGLDELMSVLEMERLFDRDEADRIVVDMAPSGHSLNLFAMMDFLDGFLEALEGFQEKHRVLARSLAGRYTPDNADDFLQRTRSRLDKGRELLQDPQRTACSIVAIAEPMSLLETQDFTTSLGKLNIPVGSAFVNRLLLPEAIDLSEPRIRDRYGEQQQLLAQFQTLSDSLFGIPWQRDEPIGREALDRLWEQIFPVAASEPLAPVELAFPEAIPPGLPDFLAEGKHLLILGGKGGVGKTTVAAAIAWELARRHPEAKVRAISIDPAHSLGDSFGVEVGAEAIAIRENLSIQEIDTQALLDEFREEYLWELAEMMSGDSEELAEKGISLAYGPEAWRQLVSQSLPGVDEMLALLTIVSSLENEEQELVVLDTAPTGHLLRFLEMPTALTDWLSWIFKLWLKYQNVAGHPELMTRLRQLRKRVVNTHKKLSDSDHTEFIGVLQAQRAIAAETERMMQAIRDRGLAQRYLVLNRYELGCELPENLVAEETEIVRLPALPRLIPPAERIAGAGRLLFAA